MKKKFFPLMSKFMLNQSLLSVMGTTTLILGTATLSEAAIIDFTGGTVYLLNGTTATTNNSGVWQNVDYYIEDGFKLDFVGASGNAFSYIVGDYYSNGNDVIHGHWDTGHYGDLMEIRVSKVDGTLFDLNSFTLTSNTDFGGDHASGHEQAYIHTSNGYSQLLPVDDWGFAGPNTKVVLGSEFDQISWFSFTAQSIIDCFGMDSFFIDEKDPELATTPEPTTLLGLLGVGALGWGVGKGRSKKAQD